MDSEISLIELFLCLLKSCGPILGAQKDIRISELPEMTIMRPALTEC